MSGIEGDVTKSGMSRSFRETAIPEEELYKTRITLLLSDFKRHVLEKTMEGGDGRIEVLLNEKEEDRTKIRLYQTQVQMVKEDFEKEREDRSRQHERAEELSHRVSMLELEIDALKQENCRLVTAHTRLIAINGYARRGEPRYVNDDGSNQD